jgi:ribonuclease HI
LNPEVIIYTDGSSLGNPGPGGYGAVLMFQEKRKEISGGFAKTTNNRMELLAVIESLKQLKDNAVGKVILIYSDSSYVVNAVEKGWVFNWVKKNFHQKKNKDLWLQFLPLYRKFKPKLEWVKGHAGIRENERCDVLAKKAAQRKNLPIDEGFGEVQSSSPHLFD